MPGPEDEALPILARREVTLWSEASQFRGSSRLDSFVGSLTTAGPGARRGAGGRALGRMGTLSLDQVANVVVRPIPTTCVFVTQVTISPTFSRSEKPLPLALFQGPITWGDHMQTAGSRRLDLFARALHPTTSIPRNDSALTLS